MLKDIINTKDKFDETYLSQYINEIESGKIHACWEMKQGLKNLAEEFYYDEYMFDTTKAYVYIDFIESNIKHTKAPFAGKPFLLELWQKALIEVLYSFKIKSIDSGKWVQRFVELLLWIARKNGKTTLIAALELTELFLCHPGSGIVCSGMNDKIADLCYTEINDMRVYIDPDSVVTWKNQKGIKNLLNNNFLRKISDSTRNKEGGNLVMAGIDEIWSLEGDTIYSPLRQSASTQEEYLIALFSSDGVIIDGFADKKLNEYLKIIKRENMIDADKRKLPWIYKMDTEDEVWKVNEQGINPLWQKANPSIGTVKKWGFMCDLCDEASVNMSTRLTFLTKDCNIKQGASERWLNPTVLEYNATYDLREFENYWAIGAVDLAETNDMVSAKVYLFKNNSSYKYVLQHYWIPKAKLEDPKMNDIKVGARYEEWESAGLLTIVDGNDIKDLGIVADWFWDVQQKYKIRIHKIGYDQKFKNDFIRRCDYYGWEDRRELIVINQSPETLHRAICQVEADIKDQLVIGLNAIDKWCLGNAGLKINGYDKAILKKSERNRRIDGAVTLVICQEMLNRYSQEVAELNPM